MQMSVRHVSTTKQIRDTSITCCIPQRGWGLRGVLGGENILRSAGIAL